MRFLIISCSLMIALPSVVLATKRPAECVFGPVLNYQNKKSCVGDEQRVSLEKLRKMIVENPEKIKKSVIFQNQIVEFCYDSALTLPIDKIVSLLPNLAQEAYLNHQYALMFIVNAIKTQDVIPQDLVEKITTDANEGHAYAQYNLGTLFANGWTKADKTQQAPDHDQSVYWLTAAAKQGHGYAQFNLAVMFEKGWTKGDGSQQAPDPDQAVYWLTPVAKQGFANAQYNLGKLFVNGWTKADGGQQAPDYDQGIYWLTPAAKQGNDSAQSNIRKCFSPVPSCVTSNVLLRDEEINGLLSKLVKSLEPIQFNLVEMTTQHNPEMILIQECTGLKLSTLHPYYNSIMQYVDHISYAGTRLLDKLSTSGFMVTCLAPQAGFYSYYSKNPNIKNKGFCMVEISGTPYYCLGDDNPKIGYTLKQLLGEQKQEVDVNIRILTAQLKTAQELTSMMVGISDEEKSNNLKNIDQQLKLVSLIKPALDDSLNLLKEWVSTIVGGRNKCCKEEYSWLFQ